MNASTGVVVASYAYDAWGGRTVATTDPTVATTDPTAASDPSAGYGGLHGYHTDWETGLHLCGRRYYGSAAGRWLNRDPLSYAGGVNVYEYCGNGPIGMSDVSGLRGLPGLPSWIGGGVSCLFSGVTDWIGASVGECTSMCTVMSQCGCGFLAAILTAGLEAVDPVSIFVSGCIASLINSLCSEVLGAVCHYLNCPRCPHESFKCRLLGAVIGTVLGCIGSALGGSKAGAIGGDHGISTRNWISGSLGIGLAGPGEAATDNDCQFAY